MAIARAASNPALMMAWPPHHCLPLGPSLSQLKAQHRPILARVMWQMTKGTCGLSDGARGWLQPLVGCRAWTNPSLTVATLPMLVVLWANKMTRRPDLVCQWATWIPYALW